MVASLSSTFTGVVVSVNERGLRLDGHESWLNLSKFAPSVVLPERGATVTVAVDSKGFLRSCELVEAAHATPFQGGNIARCAHDVGHGVASSASAAQNAASGQNRDRTITRLAVLKAAAEYASSKPQSSSADVLKIAASWERWVLRSDDVDAVDIRAAQRTAEDLTEAF